MPIIGQTIPAAAFDTQASSPDRHRRNWQVLSALIAAGNLINIDPNGGLKSSSSGIGVKVDPAGALSVGSAGVAVKVDGTTIKITGDQLVGSPSGVTSVGLTGSTVFNITGSPVTSSGTINLGFANGGAHSFLAVDASGNGSLRTIASGDLPAGTGTVTSVALSAPAAFLTVSGSPVTTTGTLALAFPASPTLPQDSSVTFTNTSTSGTINGLSILPTFNQASGTASNIDLHINRTKTAVGSGVQAFLKFDVAGVQKFRVLDTGGITSAGGNITATTGNIVASSGVIQAVRINAVGNGVSDLIQFNAQTFIDANFNLYATNNAAVMIDGAGHFIGTGPAPTIAAGVGAGTGPTVAIAGFDTGGTVSVTTGTLPTGAAAVVATITFGGAWATAPSAVILTPANAVTAALGGLSVFVNPAAVSTSQWVIDSNTVALAASTAYKWFFHVMG